MLIPSNGVGTPDQGANAFISDNAFVARGSKARGAVAQNDQISVYQVREGDTLSEIASMFNVSVNTIIWANDEIRSTRSIRPGQTLVILPISGIEHTIKKGDSISSVAKKYGAEAEEVADYNGLSVDASLAIGDTLIVPGGAIAAPAQPSTTASSKGAPMLSGYFSNPLPGGRLTQNTHGKNAVDIGARPGTAVYAAAAGTVRIAQSGWNGGYGTYVVIEHANGTQTLYAHLSSLSVKPGMSVSTGSVLGGVGTTGRATGPHLHFEVRGARNPLAR